MKATIYIFGNFADGYSQYPDNYTNELFNTVIALRQGATELVYHRDGALTYYIYTREISRSEKTFIGLCYVFNDVLIADFASLFDAFEDAVTNIAVKGELLEFSNDGSLTTKIRQLYSNSGELQRVSDYLNSKLTSISKHIEKLPPVNFAVPKDSWRTFSFAELEKVQRATKDYSNIRVIKGENYDTKSLKDYAHKLKTQNDEIKTLKNDNSKQKDEISKLKRKLASKGIMDPSVDKSQEIVYEGVQQNKPIVRLIRKILAIVISFAICSIVGYSIYILLRDLKNRKEQGQEELRQIEMRHSALKDSCNVHFKEGLLDKCHEDIEQMKVLEEKHTGLKSFSESYSITLDSLESKRRRLPKTN